jgi:hypothetical protein
MSGGAELHRLLQRIFSETVDNPQKAFSNNTLGWTQIPIAPRGAILTYR